MTRYLLILFFLLILKEAVAAGDDSTSFVTDEIEIFSNRIVTDRFSSPVKVQSISRIQMENKNGETLSDILQLAGNAFVKTYGGNYSLNTLALNGLGAEHTLILLNGSELNSHQNNLLDLSTISKDNIEEIEILNNGSSSIYGSEAIGGVVNIITKNNSVKDFIVNLNLQAGSYDQKKIYMGLGKRIENLNAYFSFGRESSLNDYEYYFHHGPEDILKQRQNSSYEFSDYSADLELRTGNSSRLKFYTDHVNIRRSIPGIEAGSDPSGSEQRDRNWNNVLSFEKVYNKNSRITAGLNYQNNLMNYFDGLSSESYYKNLVLSNSFQFNFIKEKYEIAAGYELNYYKLKSNETVDNASRFQPSVYAVSSLKLFRNVTIYPSVRYDHIQDINKNVVTGKLGLNVKLFEKTDMNLKASAGNNYASPTFNELYWKDSGNLNLKPESSFNADAGVIWGFDLFSKNVLEVTYTYIDAKDKIIWSPVSNGLWSPQNVSRSVSNVILLDGCAMKNLTSDLSLNASVKFSYTSSLKKSSDYAGDPSYDKQIFYIPEEMTKCNLSIKYKNSGLNVFYTFTGRRYTNFENTDYLPAVDLFEGNVSQNFTVSKVEAQVKFEVNNIFNADYQMIAGYPMPLRNFKLLLSLKY